MLQHPLRDQHRTARFPVERHSDALTAVFSISPKNRVSARCREFFAITSSVEGSGDEALDRQIEGIFRRRAAGRSVEIIRA